MRRKGLFIIVGLGVLFLLVILIFSTQVPDAIQGEVRTLRVGNYFMSSDNLKKSVVLKHSDKYTALSGLPNLGKDSDAKVISSDSFDALIEAAKFHPRKRRMIDLTKNPTTNSLQSLMNVWTNGSFSPVHKHSDYSEVFVVLKGALAFFTFSSNGTSINCNVLHDGSFSKLVDPSKKVEPNNDRAIIIEKDQFHAMTAAPPELGWPGHAVILELSAHRYDTTVPTKTLAPFAPVFEDGLNGHPTYFTGLLKLCPSFRP